MSAPKTPADVRGTWDALGTDISRRQSLLTGYRHGGVDLTEEEVAEHAVTLLAKGAHLARLVDAFVVDWGLTAAVAGVPLDDVAAAAGVDVAALRIRLLSFVDLQEGVHQRPDAKHGMDPVQAEQVRALISGAST